MPSKIKMWITFSCCVFFHICCVVCFSISAVLCVFPYLLCCVFFHICCVVCFSISAVLCVFSYLLCCVFFHICCVVCFSISAVLTSSSFVCQSLLSDAWKVFPKLCDSRTLLSLSFRRFYRLSQSFLFYWKKWWELLLLPACALKHLRLYFSLRC